MLPAQAEGQISTSAGQQKEPQHQLDEAVCTVMYTPLCQELANSGICATFLLKRLAELMPVVQAQRKIAGGALQQAM